MKKSLVMVLIAGFSLLPLPFGAWMGLQNPRMATAAVPAGIIYVADFGAVGDGIADDTTAVTNAISTAQSSKSTLMFNPGNYKLTSQIVISSTSGIRIIMAPGATLVSSVGLGNYAVRLTNCRFCNIDLNLRSNGNGMLLENTIGANNLYNRISGEIRFDVGLGTTKSASRPPLGGGPIGIHFKFGGGGANYFNRLDRVRLRSFDTGIRLDDGANANIIIDPQIEDFWYGIEIMSDENHVRGGFCHFSAGKSENEAVECLYLGTTGNSVIFNSIQGIIAEPGAFSRGYHIANGSRNHIFIHDNTPLSGISPAENQVMNWYSSRLSNLVVDGATHVTGTLTTSGWVGVGTATPAQPLHILQSGASVLPILLTNTSLVANRTTTIAFTHSATDATGRAEIRAYAVNPATASGSEIRFVTQRNDGPGTLVENMVIKQDGSVGIGTTNPASLLHVNGILTTTAKNFQIPHPLEPDKKFLLHSSLEGPEMAVYYRGEARLVNGEIVITLPSYFEALTRGEQRTVQLTPVDGWAALYVVEGVRLGRFMVRAANGSNLNQRFYWEVKAVRADLPPLVVEPSSDAGAMKVVDSLKKAQ